MVSAYDHILPPLCQCNHLKPTFLLGDAAHVPAGPLSQPSPTNSRRTTPFWLQDLLARLSDYVIFSSRVLAVHGGSNIVCMPFLHDFKCFSFPVIPHILFPVLLHAHASMMSCYAFMHVQFTEVPPVVLLDKVFECSWNCVHDSVASTSTQQLSATDARVKAQIYG